MNADALRIECWRWTLGRNSFGAHRRSGWSIMHIIRVASKLFLGRRPLALLYLGLMGTLAACNTATIPNTDVPDTQANREVLEFVEQYRNGVEAQDPARILRLVSDDYYDDNGTPSARDDVDYSMFRERLARLESDVLEVRYDIRYRRVTFREDRVLVDVTYIGRFKVSTPEGERWSRHLSPNRMELVYENGELRFISGL